MSLFSLVEVELWDAFIGFNNKKLLAELKAEARRFFKC